MADKPDMKAAVAFYLISIAGTVFLAIAPALKEGNWTRAAINGAVLGFVAYATYDLTNQATLAVWQTKLTIIDLIWGTTLTMLSATGGYFAARWAEGGGGCWGRAAPYSAARRRWREERGYVTAQARLAPYARFHLFAFIHCDSHIT